MTKKSIYSIQIYLFLFAICLPVARCYSQDSKVRKAFVLGNKNYHHFSTLQLTLNDADSVSVALKELNFEVYKFHDLTMSETLKELDQFIKTLKEGDIFLLYYSGHGKSFLGNNFIIPVDYSSKNDADLITQALDINIILEKVKSLDLNNIIIILDACRDSDLIKSESSSFQRPKTIPKNTLFAFATDYGLVSNDRSISMKNGIYKESLLQYLRMPYEIRTIFDSTALRTYRFSKSLKQSSLQRPVQEYSFFYPLYLTEPKNLRANTEIRDLIVRNDSLRRVNELKDLIEKAELNHSNKRFNTAFAAFEKAAILGDYNSIIQTSIMLQTGQGVEVDFRHAAFWLKKAVKMGCLKCKTNLGILYKNGEGVKRNLYNAFSLLEEAATDGDQDAIVLLAIAYQNGEGTSVNLYKAFELFLTSAELGNVYSQTFTGLAYLKGLGVRKNKRKAKLWLTKAKLNGDMNASELLDML